jgi:hypothetical protein
VALDPGTSACANFTPAPLQTNRGTLYLYEDNTDDETGFGTPGPTSVAWGVFWSELGRKGDHDEDGDDDRDDRGSDRRD